MDSATPDGLSRARVWGDQTSAKIDELVQESVPILKARFAEERRSGKKPIISYLALSGGGGDGAFGAGLLVGWSEAGTRPSFGLVTGVSAGALIAPFAYLGSSRDEQLSQLFTQINKDSVLTPTVVSGLLGGPALADSAPLARMIEAYVDQQFLADIARERAKGRMLLIGTTNLEAQRPVLWDMGLIAASKDPQAPALFRKILLASASIPGVFPPVRIQVQAAGQTFDELHVDGGVTQEVFLAPSAFAFKDIDRLVGVSFQRRLYIIRNGKVTPEWEFVEEKTLPIAQRSITTLTKNQGIGDLFRIYTSAKRDGMDFNLATIPSDFNMKSPGPFDRDYMNALYQYGRQLGRNGYAWQKAPPGLDLPRPHLSVAHN